MKFNFPINKKDKPYLPFRRNNIQNSEAAFEDQARLLSNFKKPNDIITIFDIGAAHGKVAEKYSKYYNNLRVYAFEPYPESFEILKKKSRIKEFIIPFQIAISNEIGLSDYYCNIFSETNSIYQANTINPEIDGLTKNVRKIKVKTITIDEFINDNGIRRIDILKMDVQGGELNVLNGALETIRKNLIAVVYTEIEFIEIYKSQPLFFDISKFLYDNNFTLFNLYNFNYIKGRLGWGDAVFINKSIFNV